MADCVFCKIIKKELPAEIAYEDEEILVFKDIEPLAPFHFLIAPKQHISSLFEARQEDKNLIGQMLLVSQKIAKEKNLKGYKLVFNVGREGGQIVEHLHLHFLAGWKNAKERDVPGMP